MIRRTISFFGKENVYIKFAVETFEFVFTETLFLSLQHLYPVLLCLCE